MKDAEGSFYETIDDITADAGVRVEGSSKEEVVCKLILATFNEMTCIERINPLIEKRVRVNGKMPFIIADLLNKILLIHERDGFVGSRCNVVNMAENTIEVSLLGEEFDPSRHASGLLIKAVTYHRLEFKKKNGKWVAQVIFDI